MKKKTIILMVISILFFSFGIDAPAQNTDIVISGIVLDSNGEAIIGASVILKGTSIGTHTNGEGRYTLGISSAQSNGILVASYIGYDNQEKAIQGMATINFVLSYSLGTDSISPQPMKKNDEEG